MSIVTPECLHLARLPEGRDAADVRHAAVEGAAGRPRRVHYGRQIGAACGDRPATRRPATLGAKTRVRLLNPRFPMLGWRCSYRTAALATARLCDRRLYIRKDRTLRRPSGRGPARQMGVAGREHSVEEANPPGEPSYGFWVPEKLASCLQSMTSAVAHRVLGLHSKRDTSVRWRTIVIRDGLDSGHQRGGNR